MFLKKLEQITINPAPLVELKISECVHFCAFLYGHGRYNPYETYILGLHHGREIDDLYSEFLDFLVGYRPGTLGAALGLNLNRDYPLWLFPWSRPWKFWNIDTRKGWYDDPFDIPDIITHFSESGIPSRMIEKEIGWLTGAYHSIVAQGYHPERFGYPTGNLLDGGARGRACIIRDGNHRISSLSALGFESVQIRCPGWNRVSLDELDNWSGVKNRFFTKDDAERIFMVYLDGNQHYHVGQGGAFIV